MKRTYHLFYTAPTGYRMQACYRATSDKDAKQYARELLGELPGRKEPELWHEKYDGEWRLVHQPCCGAPALI